VNFKYLLLTLSLLPTLSYADTPAQPTEKTTMQKVNEFVTWRKVAGATGLTSLVAMIGGAASYFSADNEARLMALSYLNRIMTRLQKKFPDATFSNVEKIAGDLAIDLDSKGVQAELKKADGTTSFFTVAYKDPLFVKYQRRLFPSVLVFLAGGALALTCLGTLTYAVIKKLTSQPESTENKSILVTA
jgi:hypothetical protein